MADREISRKLKEKVLISCVTPVYLYGRETVALPQRDNNRGWRFARATGSGGLQEFCSCISQLSFLGSIAVPLMLFPSISTLLFISLTSER